MVRRLLPRVAAPERSAEERALGAAGARLRAPRHAARRLVAGAHRQVELVVAAGGDDVHHRGQPQASQGARARAGVAGALRVELNAAWERFRDDEEAWVDRFAELEGDVIDYVPCYRSEAGSGTAQGFIAWT